MEEENGPRVAAMLARDDLEREQLLKAAVIVGNVMSAKQIRSSSYQMLFNIWVKLRGLSME